MRYFPKLNTVKFTPEACPTCGTRRTGENTKRESPVRHPVQGYVRGKTKVDPRQMSLFPLFAERSSRIRPDILAQMNANLSARRLPIRSESGASITSFWRPWQVPPFAYAPQLGPAANGIGNRARGPYCGQAGSYYTRMRTRGW